jgi:glycosyltransferase 2 family protein
VGYNPSNLTRQNYMPKKLNFQTLIYFLLAVAFLYALYNYRDQLTEVLTVLRQGLWYYILAAALILFVNVYVQTSLYSSIYHIFGIPSEKRRILPLYLVTYFVTVAAPSGGLSAMLPFLQYARRGEVGMGRIIIANLVRTILWYSTFGLFLALGMIYLFLAHSLEWYELSAALVIFAADLGMVSALLLAWIAPRLLERVMNVISHLLERLFGLLRRPPPLTDRQLKAFAHDLNRAPALMRVVGWRRLLAPIGWAFLNEACNLLMLYLIARAFNFSPSFAILVTVYSISILFYIVSPTPGGIGFVEGSMILVMTTLDVPQHLATVITLAYRGLAFWGPFMLGFIALRWANAHPAPEAIAIAESESTPAP